MGSNRPGGAKDSVWSHLSAALTGACAFIRKRTGIRRRNFVTTLKPRASVPIARTDQVVLDTIAKAAKASKKKADTYQTALMEGCFKDGQVQIVKKPKESDLDLVARVAMGLIKGGVNLEQDKWLGVLWRLSQQ